MAVNYDGTYFPEPTGAVPFDDAPVDTSVVVDPTPTGAVENTGEPITTKYGPSGLRSTNTVTIPETTSFQAPGVKVINPPTRPAAKGSTTAETDANPTTGSTKTQRAAHASDDLDGGR